MTIIRSRFSLLTLALGYSIATAPMAQNNNNGNGPINSFQNMPNLMFSIQDFYASGTVYASGNSQIVIGDHIGRDYSDADGDGNPEMIWEYGSPYIGAADGEFLFSRKSYRGNFRFKADACIGVTYVSYQFLGAVKLNNAFSGAPLSLTPLNPVISGYSLAFLTRWEDPTALYLFHDNGAYRIPDSLTPAMTNGAICANYSITRNQGVIRALVNGVQVFERSLQNPENEWPLAFAVRSWDSPVTISNWSLKPGGSD
jgi:hypothetical protein